MSDEQLAEWRLSLKRILEKQIDPKVLVALLDDIKSGQIRLEDGVLRIENKLSAMNERYMSDGEKITTNGPGSIHVTPGEVAVTNEMEQLRKAEKWSELIDLCNQENSKALAWWTPYFYLAAAYLNSGMLQKAKDTFRVFIDHAANNGDYSEQIIDARSALTQLETIQ